MLIDLSVIHYEAVYVFISECRICCMHHASFFLVQLGSSSCRERTNERERMDTNHSQQWVIQLFFLFTFTTMMMMDEGQAYAHTQLALMRCLYSPRQNANISSILILIVQKEKTGLTDIRRVCIFK